MTLFEAGMRVEQVKVSSLWPINSSSCNLILGIGAAKADFVARILDLRFGLVELAPPAHDLLGREAFDIAVIEHSVGAGVPSEGDCTVVLARTY